MTDPQRLEQTPVAYLDWRHNRIGPLSGRCRICHGPALMRDEHNKPCHLVCKQTEAGGRIAAAAAAYGSAEP